jgi:hypothetical protein
LGRLIALVLLTQRHQHIRRRGPSGVDRDLAPHDAAPHDLFAGHAGEPVRAFRLSERSGCLIFDRRTRRGKLRSESAARKDDVDELSIGKLAHIAIQT